MESKFTALGLGNWLTRQIAAVGFKDPKPIQVNCIPPILEGKACGSDIQTIFLWNWILGRDCLGCAKTGSGKTAAFALPILQKLSEDPYGVYALVITPTRCVVTMAHLHRLEMIVSQARPNAFLLHQAGKEIGSGQTPMHYCWQLSNFLLDNLRNYVIKLP